MGKVVVSSNTYIHFYAKAIFALAIQQQTTDAWSLLLSGLEVIAQLEEVKQLLLTPQFTRQKRIEFLASFCHDSHIKLEPSAFNFIQLLLENRHMVLISRIAHAYHKMLDEHNKILKVHVTSAHAVSENTRQVLITRLAARYSREIKLELTIQPQLIAGMVVRIKNKVINASLHDQLQRIHKFLCDSECKN